MFQKISMFILLLMPCSLFAKEPVRGLGFAAGQISGLGISYRMMGEKYGFQATFGGLSQKQDDEYQYDEIRKPYEPEYWQPSTAPFTFQERLRETDVNLGLMVMKVLHSAKWSTFYAFTGASIFYQVETFNEYHYQYELYDDNSYSQMKTGGPTKKSSSSSTIYGGAGIGIEIKFTQNIRLAVEWPLTLSSKGDFIMYIPQTGLHYFF